MIEVDHPNKCNTVTPPRPTDPLCFTLFLFFFQFRMLSWLTSSYWPGTVTTSIQVIMILLIGDF